jgi:hypothetical protein
LNRVNQLTHSVWRNTWRISGSLRRNGINSFGWLLIQSIKPTLPVRCSRAVQFWIMNWNHLSVRLTGVDSVSWDVFHQGWTKLDRVQWVFTSGSDSPDRRKDDPKDQSIKAPCISFICVYVSQQNWKPSGGEMKPDLSPPCQRKWQLDEDQSMWSHQGLCAWREDRIRHDYDWHPVPLHPVFSYHMLCIRQYDSHQPIVRKTMANLLHYITCILVARDAGLQTCELDK